MKAWRGRGWPQQTRNGGAGMWGVLKQTQLRTGRPGRPSKGLPLVNSHFLPHLFLNLDFLSQERQNMSSLWKIYITEYKHVEGTLEVFLCDPHSPEMPQDPKDKEPTKVTRLPLLQSLRSNLSQFTQNWLCWEQEANSLPGSGEEAPAKLSLASTALAPQPTVSPAGPFGDLGQSAPRNYL